MTEDHYDHAVVEQIRPAARPSRKIPPCRSGQNYGRPDRLSAIIPQCDLADTGSEPGDNLQSTANREMLANLTSQSRWRLIGRISWER